MSYLQLARMAPTTRSEHWEVAISVLTHSAMDPLTALIPRGLPGYETCTDFWMLHLAFTARESSRSVRLA